MLNPPPAIRRVRVWPALLRALHWSLAVSTLIALASGWLMQQTPALYALARPWHLSAAAVLSAALTMRLVLLAQGRAVAHWRALWPQRGQGAAMLAMLRFYVSFTRAPLPAWYAHNPLWGPLYLLGFILMAWLALSGIVLWRAPGATHALLQHTAAAPWLLAWVAAHLLAVVLHDWKGSGADVSAMLNGHRIFVPRPSQPPPIAGHEVQLHPPPAQSGDAPRRED